MSLPGHETIWAATPVEGEARQGRERRVDDTARPLPCFY